MNSFYNTALQIPFKWEVVDKNKAANNLLVKFQSAGKPEVLVGTPFPPKDQDVNEFMTRYAPFQLWAIEDTTHDLAIGESAEVIPVPVETSSISLSTESLSSLE